MKQRFYKDNKHKKIVNSLSLAVVFLLAVGLTSAITIDAGDCETISIETSNKIFWTASGNSSSIEGINITQDGLEITICLDVMFQEDNLTISLIEEQTKEVIKEVNVGGGGGSSTRWKTEYVDRNVTKYIDQEVIKEVPGETIEVDKEIIKESGWSLFWLIVGVLIIVGFVIKWFLKDKEEIIHNYSDERGYKNNE